MLAKYRSGSRPEAGAVSTGEPVGLKLASVGAFANCRSITGSRFQPADTATVGNSVAVLRSGIRVLIASNAPVSTQYALVATIVESVPVQLPSEPRTAESQGPLASAGS